MNTQSQDNRVLENITLHERISNDYIDRHSEIYNAIEQRRLATDIDHAFSCIRSSSASPKCLDFGCGRGNLSMHFLDRGGIVTAADITPSFLQLVSDLASSRGQSISTHLLNGIDLREFDDNSFDFVASYSVLHHVPDYLAIVREFTRIVKPGGIIFIDHEASDELWNPSGAFLEFKSRSNVRRSAWSLASSLFDPRWYLRKWKKLKNPRYQEEGDIHVWPDDHIEWNRIGQIMADSHVHPVLEKDYLLYYSHYSEELYWQYAQRCSDVHLYIGRKQ